MSSGTCPSERSPLLSKRKTSDEEAGDKFLRSEEYSICGFIHALVTFLAAHNVEPFASQSSFLLCSKRSINESGQENAAEYERILATFGSDLLASFPSSGRESEPKASTSFSVTSTIPSHALYICALLLLMLECQVETPHKAPVSKQIKLENQVRRARQSICQAIVRHMDSITEAQDNTADDVIADSDQLVEILFAAVPVEAESDMNSLQKSAVDLLLRTVQLPKTPALRSVLVHPVVAMAVERAWIQPHPSLCSSKPRYVKFDSERTF